MACVVVGAFVAAAYSTLASTSKKSNLSSFSKSIRSKESAGLEPTLEKESGKRSKPNIYAEDTQKPLTKVTSELA